MGAEQADRAVAAAAGGGEPVAEKHVLIDLQAVGVQGGAGVVAQLRPGAVEVAADVGAGQPDPGKHGPRKARPKPWAEERRFGTRYVWRFEDAKYRTAFYDDPEEARADAMRQITEQMDGTWRERPRAEVPSDPGRAEDPA